MEESPVISAERYKYWHVDFQNGTIKIVHQDGQILEQELEPKFQARDSQIATSTFDWEKWWIFSTSIRGDLVITEGFNPNSPPPFNGRPSVYLDQNHWRTVADVLHDPDRVYDPRERSAAQDLIRLASEGNVVLPLSMGHFVETAGLHSKRRYEVGIAALHKAEWNGAGGVRWVRGYEGALGWEDGDVLRLCFPTRGPLCETLPHLALISSADWTASTSPSWPKKSCRVILY